MKTHLCVSSRRCSYSAFYLLPAVVPIWAVGIVATDIDENFPATTGSMSPPATALFEMAPFPFTLPTKRTGSSGDNSKGAAMDFDVS
jgi:hypothetical protein